MLKYSSGKSTLFHLFINVSDINKIKIKRHFSVRKMAFMFFRCSVFKIYFSGGKIRFKIIAVNPPAAIPDDSNVFSQSGANCNI